MKSSQQKKTQSPTSIKEHESHTKQNGKNTMSHEEAGRLGAEARWSKQHSKEHGRENRNASSHTQDSHQTSSSGKGSSGASSIQNQDFTGLFIEELADMYSAETQILEALPKLIDLVCLPDLVEVLSKHVEETREQKIRLERIFNLLNTPRRHNKCLAMEGLIKEANEIVYNKNRSFILDAAIISACQKIEHYEIASYGTLCSFAKHLNAENTIKNLLEDSLFEESTADKKLTKIAEGSFFSIGINQEAAKCDMQTCH